MTTFEKAVKTYNNIMNDICREYLTIGTRHTESPEEKSKWTLRDLVSEMQYTLDIYDDPDCMYWQDAHAPEQSRFSFPDGDWHHQWVLEKARMSRFINKYAGEAMKLRCYEAHCSRYD